MPGFHINAMGEMVLDAVDDICVVDVYDLASDIGKECEKIIDHFGPDSVTSLMPKVINALELLEALATKNERENATVQELNDRISQLESEKLEKAEFRKRFEKVSGVVRPLYVSHFSRYDVSRLLTASSDVFIHKRCSGPGWEWLDADGCVETNDIYLIS